MYTIAKSINFDHAHWHEREEHACMVPKMFLVGPTTYLGAVYTMDHEVVPRKRPILRGTTSWDDFYGPSY
jgi:hypothetical protein